jgi:hypothetical protein
MMEKTIEFEVVDIPDVPPTTGSSAPVVEALQAHIGKAIVIPVEDRDANSFRKTIRSSLLNRGILDEYNFRTQVDPQKKTMTVWLEKKTAREKVNIVLDPKEEVISNE